MLTYELSHPPKQQFWSVFKKSASLTGCDRGTWLTCERFEINTYAMRKLKLFICLLLNYIIIHITTGCYTDNFDKTPLNLGQIMLDIENKIESNEFLVVNSFDKFDKDNKRFFEKIKNIDITDNYYQISKTVKKAVSSYNNLYKKTYTKNSSNEKLSKIEELILKSYFKSLSISMSDDNISIAEYYIEQVNEMEIPQKDKEFCLNRLSLHKNLLFFVDDSNLDVVDSRLALRQKWPPCAHRDCFDCCMYRKSQEFEKKTWVEKAWILLHLPEEIGQWIVYCIYNCHINP